MLQYRRKLERGELAPVTPAAAFLLNPPPPTPTMFFCPCAGVASSVFNSFLLSSSAEGTGDSSHVLHSDGEDVQHHPHPWH